MNSHWWADKYSISSRFLKKFSLMMSSVLLLSDCTPLFLQYLPVTNFSWTLAISLFLKRPASRSLKCLCSELELLARAFIQNMNSCRAVGSIYLNSSVTMSLCDFFLSFRLYRFFRSFLFSWDRPLWKPWFIASWRWRSSNDLQQSLGMYSASGSPHLQLFGDSVSRL